MTSHAARRLPLAGLVLVLSAFSLSAHAQQDAGAIDPGLYSGMRWRSLGPARGGRSIAVAGSATRPQRVLLRRRRRRGVEDHRLRHDLGGRRRRRASAPRRSARSPSRRRTPTSSTPAGRVVLPRQHHPGRRRLQDDATPARRGRTSASATTEVISKIRVHPTNPDIVYAAVLGHSYDAHPDARRLSHRRTAARRGSACCSATTGPAPSTSRWTRRTPTCSTRRMWEVYRTPWSMESGGPGSGLFKSTDGGTTWTEITKNTRPAGGAVGQGRRLGVGRRQQPRLRDHRKRQRRRLRLRRRRRDVEARPTRTATCASARSTTRTSSPTRWTRTRSTSSTCQFFKSTDGGKTFPTQLASAARRQPRPVDRAERQQADGAGQRRRRQRLGQRRADLVGPGLSDRPVLQRLHDQARAVSRLRRAAGQQHGVRRQPEQSRRRRGQPAADLLRRRRRRERLHRARSDRHQRVLRRQLRRLS